VVEVDGEEYHRDKAARARRDRELGVPVLHLRASEVGHPQVLTKVMRWLANIFGASLRKATP
jgi:hypothetical protein